MAAPHENVNVDPRARKVMQMFAAMATGDAPDNASKLLADIHSDHTEPNENAMSMVYGAHLEEPMPEQVMVTGPDGNEVPLDVFRPQGPGPFPCVVYLHGGGMMVLNTAIYRRVLQDLCLKGAVVVAPDFRNSPKAPYPGGVNDCLAGLQWAQENMADLNVSKIVVAGESGGGLLALSLPIVARAAGNTGPIDGVWADCPMTNRYPTTTPTGSMVEFENYILTLNGITVACRLYCEDKDDALFPANATDEQLKTLPPTMFSVYEMDPLRDEAIALYRRMLNLELPVQCMTHNGMLHGASVSMFCPDVRDRCLAGIVAFGKSL